MTAISKVDSPSLVTIHIMYITIGVAVLIFIRRINHIILLLRLLIRFQFNCVFVVVGLRRCLLRLSKSLPFGCRVSPIRFLRILIFRQESDWQKEVSVRNPATE
jgi:hypothetical protein